MPTTYNKVTVNGTTLIDLSQDTVSSAADIVSGKTGHLNDGTPVTGTAVVPSGSISIASNGTVDVTNYASANVNVSGSSKNFQCANGVNRVATTTYTEVSGQSLTVAKTGTYNVYWSGYRSSTSGTSGSQLYIDDTAYGSARTTFSNNGQAVKLTGVSLTKDQVVSVRARARNTSSYMYVSNLTIEET